MKLRKLLSHIDFLLPVELRSSTPENAANDFPLSAETSHLSYSVEFCGNPLDIPYWLANFWLDTDDNGEAISIETIKGVPTLVIYIREQKEES